MNRILVPAILLLLWKDASSEPRLRYVTTARQKGPVGHRDPIGVLSPDGTWVAYSEGRFLKLQHVEGGPVSGLEPMSLDIREIVWFPDSRRLAVPDRASGGAGLAGTSTISRRWAEASLARRRGRSLKRPSGTTEPRSASRERARDSCSSGAMSKVVTRGSSLPRGG
jgi:hypothetical protein